MIINWTTMRDAQVTGQTTHAWRGGWTRLALAVVIAVGVAGHAPTVDTHATVNAAPALIGVTLPPNPC